MRNIIFAADCYYHIYNRGVDKRQIFMDDDDRCRFLHDVWEFNDTAPVAPFIRRTVGDLVAYSDTVGPLSRQKSRTKIVEVISFCLMPNHFHLLLKQLTDNGISSFMEKMGKGYAQYFNKKYGRSGALFQGTFKAKHIDNDAYLTHLTKYIHLNPVDLCEPEWKEKGLQNPETAKDFLRNYRWSSLKDYIGEKNYPSLIQKDLIISMIGGEPAYQKFVTNFLADNEAIKEYALD